MKQLLIFSATLMLFAMIACQPEAPATNTEESAAPDYADFDMKVKVIRTFIKAFSDENVELQSELLADTMKWSPAFYNGDKWLGKDDYLQALKGYQDAFENIHFQEGIVQPDTTFQGMWSGSVFPKETATNEADVIRVYGTWLGTYSATGKTGGAKWYALESVNKDGKITSLSEYFDVGGLAAQVAPEESN